MEAVDAGAGTALTLILMFLSFCLILGGRRGGAWGLRMIVRPVQETLERRIQGFILKAALLAAAYYLGSRMLDS